jgi:hypothetical protein
MTSASPNSPKIRSVYGMFAVTILSLIGLFDYSNTGIFIENTLQLYKSTVSLRKDSCYGQFNLS